MQPYQPSDHGHVLNAIHGTLKDLHDSVKGRDALDDSMHNISSLIPYVVNYRNRYHVFIWLPSTQVLSMEEYGQGTVQGQIWINLGIKAGIKIYAPNVVSGTVQLITRCTDQGLA